MRNRDAQAIALGGVLGALAVVVMCMGGLIPVATYICPMVCTVLLYVVNRRCGSRISWAWYGLVTLLSLIMGPDKEAAAVFGVIGYYPILKPVFERSKLGILWKTLLFNGSVLLLYWAMLHLLGLNQLLEEFSELGIWGGALLLALGNLTFFLLDRLLSALNKR